MSEFQKIAPNTYRRWDPVLLKRVTVRFEGSGEKKLMHVRIEQPKWVVNTILDDNVALQNSFAGYGKTDGFYQASRIPSQIYWGTVMPKCGFQAGHGYDEKAFKRLVNDRDYSKFKIIPGKV